MKRFSGWVACGLCILLPLLAGCGDFCLFCDGGGGGGGGGGQGRTAEAGDVILADQYASSISIYESSDNVRRSLVTGHQDVSGLALYSSAAEETCDNYFDGLTAFQTGGTTLGVLDTFEQQAGQPDRLSLAVIPKGMTFPYGTDQSNTDQTTTDLLFFTVNTENALYVYDLTGASLPDGFENPHAITNSDLRTLFGSDFFQSPTALAIHVDAGTAALFILNDNGAASSVRRLSLNLSTWFPGSPREIASMKETGWRLFDIAYNGEDQSDELFVSMRTEGQTGAGGQIFVIPDATNRTTSVTLASAKAFVARAYWITGLTVTPAGSQQNPAHLLALRANELGQVEEFDIELGGDPEAVLNFSLYFAFPEALTYDCTYKRLLMTDVPYNNDFERTFFEIFPAS